jgi:hypothetical protein
VRLPGRAKAILRRAVRSPRGEAGREGGRRYPLADRHDLTAGHARPLRGVCASAKTVFCRACLELGRQVTHRRDPKAGLERGRAAT